MGDIAPQDVDATPLFRPRESPSLISKVFEDEYLCNERFLRANIYYPDQFRPWLSEYAVRAAVPPSVFKLSVTEMFILLDAKMENFVFRDLQLPKVRLQME